MKSHFGFKPRQSKQSNLSKLEEKADRLLSEVVRLTAADDKGYCYCITCDDYKHWTEMECGHYVKRRHMATRYELKNVGPQCHTCNCHFDGREDDHGLYIDRKYGEGTAEELRRIGEPERKFMAHELQGMIEELKVELKALKSEKFGLTQTRE
jgi:hypothetical protein